MDGATLKAVAVGGTRTRDPISLARAVMEKSLMSRWSGPGRMFRGQSWPGAGGPSSFFTERRWQALVKQLTRESRSVPPRPAGAPLPGQTVPVAMLKSCPTPPLWHCWSGCAGQARHIAAGRSTGAMQVKMPGRVGDCSIIGVGHICVKPILAPYP